MSWRLRKSLGLGGGAKSTITPNGLGMSWGLGGIRLGISPTGACWISVSIPGTGVSYLKYISNPRKTATLDQIQTKTTQPDDAKSDLVNSNTSFNQNILEQIKKSKS